MGRIADAALRLLDGGPQAARDLGATLARRGVTRARDPGAAVRRALRDDPRAMALPDGRLASLAQALDGVALTAMVDARAIADRSLPVDGDLAPLALLPVGPRVPLPDGARPGAPVVVRIDARNTAALAAPMRRAGRRPADEEALLGALRRHLRPPGGPGVASLALLVAEVTATNAQAFRAPGRPLTEVVERAGFEVHLGWVGPAGMDWAAITSAHADALDEQALALLRAERVDESIALQRRLVDLFEENGLADRAPAARRRLARTLARHGALDEARRVVRESFPADDPADRYQAAVLAHREGDHVEARRMVEEGLARTHDPGADVAVALADLGSDIDDQAAFAATRAELADRIGRPADLAEALVKPRRSYLVEALVDAAFEDLSDEEAEQVLRGMAERGDDVGRDACIAVGAVLAGPPGRLARSLAAPRGHARAARASVAGLVEAHASTAWETSLDDAPDQVQVVVAVAKEADRVAPLVALIDIEEFDGGLKDAFFLPDMVLPRLRFEVLDPLAEHGLPVREVPVRDAVARLRSGLRASEELGWVLPSIEAQPVMERLERWVLADGIEGGSAPPRTPPRA